MFIGPLVCNVWDPVERDLKYSQWAFLPRCSWERALNELPLMLVISVYPWISSASLHFLLVPPVCQWWPSSTCLQLSLYPLSGYFTLLPTYNADVGPAMTGSHAVTGRLLEPGLKISICFWLLAGCSSSELGNSLSFLVLNCPFAAVGEAATPEWKPESACEEPRNRWGMDKLKD